MVRINQCFKEGRGNQFGIHKFSIFKLKKLKPSGIFFVYFEIALNNLNVIIMLTMYMTEQKTQNNDSSTIFTVVHYTLLQAIMSI